MTPTATRRGGLYCYVMTPFTQGGDVDFGALDAYVKAIIDAGVNGLTCLASTCEGAYLAEDERFKVAEAVCRAAAGRVMVNIGVGAVSTRQVIRYAKHAEECGATRLMIDMQTYFPVSFDAAYRHYAQVAEATSLPIRLYNITETTRFDFTPERVAKMGAIPAIDSVKESSGDVTRIRDIRSLCGDRFELFCGFHFMVLDAFRFGAVGWEAGLHPLIADACVALYRALAIERDEAKGRRLYEHLTPLFYFFKYYGVPQTLKAMSAWSNIKLGIPRAPLSPLTDSQTKRLEEILRGLELI